MAKGKKTINPMTNNGKGVVPINGSKNGVDRFPNAYQPDAGKKVK